MLFGLSLVNGWHAFAAMTLAWLLLPLKQGITWLPPSTVSPVLDRSSDCLEISLSLCKCYDNIIKMVPSMLWKGEVQIDQRSNAVELRLVLRFYQHMARMAIIKIEHVSACLQLN